MGIEFPQAPNLQEQQQASLHEVVNFVMTAAQIIQRKSGKPLADVMHDYTILHELVMRGDTPDANWKEYAEGLPQQSDPVAWTVKFIRDRNALQQAPQESEFGCFTYVYKAKEQTIFMHFHNEDADHVSPLSEERRERRTKELKRMFADIREKHPEARDVRGFSWLYNIEAYKRLFPLSYTASVSADKYPQNIRSAGLWSQFATADGHINHGRAQLFFARLEHVDMEHLEDAFPLQVLAAHAPIKDFYQFYGIEANKPSPLLPSK